MVTRTQVSIDPEMQQRAHARAAEQGISFAEYIRRLLARDLGDSPARKSEVSLVFDLVDEGPVTNIARDKDRMIGEAVWEEHQRKTTGSRNTHSRPKVGRR
jgi:hypothetical protein